MNRAKLTKREREIWDMASSGMNQVRIARELGLTTVSIGQILQNAANKLDYDPAQLKLFRLWRYRK